MPNTPNAVAGIDAMLHAIYDWQDQADALVTTSDEDRDVIATLDSAGRLIELWVRPGLQHELSTVELEDRINEVIAPTAALAQQRMQRISDQFIARFALLSHDVARGPRS